MPKNNDRVRVIPLGGIGEIGKNMMAFEYDRKILVVDAGLMFPEEEMLGIDLVIPDITYLVENRDRIQALILTHGHEDHIGAVPYILRQLNIPIYATRLTLGLIEGKLKEHGLEPSIPPVCVRAGDKVQLGPFTVEFIRVSHSIADVVGLGITCPAGIIVHTSDFKFDQTPIGGETTDFHKFAEYGEKGVLLLLSDSTNAERPGYTLSERQVGEAFEDTFRSAQGRIFVATFASNIHRIQQIVEAAWKFDRKICVVGRSMENVVGIATDLGYLDIPEGMMVDVDDIDRIPPGQLVIITTGSQGEPMSALTRMAMAEHKKIGIMPGDTVIISASPIPGNEKFIGRTINHLFRQGADVIYEAFSGVHVSGHASQEELKMMLNLVKPRYFIPVHGEYRHLVKHARLASAVGIPEENIFIPDIGDVLEFGPTGARAEGKVTAGKVLVDGLSVGDVGNVVLRDRKQLAEDGILIVVVTINKQTGAIVAGPDIVSRGFVYIKESEALLEDAKASVKDVLKKCEDECITEWGTIKRYIRDTLGQFTYERMKRRPMILPIVMEV
ncbi:MAG TPA: ribonuclease J [Firmicutes bacterium]|nr:ribonuclease J [Bacillota bacterium]